jgi:hypothetical protein
MVWWFTQMLLIQMIPGSNLSLETGYLSEVFCGYLQSLQENAGIIPIP